MGAPTVDPDSYEAWLEAARAAGGDSPGVLPVGNGVNPYSASNSQTVNDSVGTPAGTTQISPEGYVVPAASGPAGVSEQLPVQTTNETGVAGNEGATAETALSQTFTPGPTPPVPGEVLTGINYGMYGPGGQELANETFVRNPQRFAAGAEEESRLRGAQGKEEGNWYRKEAMRQAIANQTFQRDQMLRQKELAGEIVKRDELAKKYTADLADTGKFWRNNGNFISGIFTALSSLGSAAGAARSYQQLNDSINRDFMQRKAAADMGIASADNHVAAMRQLFHDKDAADMYALGASYAVAANELKEISSNYVGPIAKARADQLIAGTMQQSNLIQMKALQQAYLSPHFQQQVIANAYKNSPGFIQYGNKTGQVPGPAQPSAGPTADINGIPTSREEAPTRPFRQPVGIAPEIQGAPQTMVDFQAPPAKGLNPKNIQLGQQITQATKAVNGGQPTGFEKDYSSFMNKQAPSPDTYKLWEGRSPGYTKLVQDHFYDLRGQAMMARTPEAQRQKFRELYNQDVERANAASKGAFEKDISANKGWAWFDHELNRIEAASSLSGKSPDEFIGWLRQLPAGQSVVSEVNKMRLAHGDKDNKWSKEQLEELEAAEKFHQALAGKVVTYYHTNIGGNQSVQERDLIQNVIDPSANWSKIRGFADEQSRAAGDKYMSALDQMDVGPRLVLMQRWGPPSKSNKLSTHR